MLEEKKSLRAILKLMSDVDDELIDISVEAFKELVGTILPDSIDENVDAIQRIREELEAKIALSAQRIKEEQALKKSFENSLKNLKTYIEYTMNDLNVTKLTGNKHVVSLVSRDQITVLDREWDSDDYIKFNVINPEAIKREFKPNKTAIKNIMAKSPELMEGYAVLEKITFAKFSRNRG